jgi:hypothetical protein
MAPLAKTLAPARRTDHAKSRGSEMLADRPGRAPRLLAGTRVNARLARYDTKLWMRDLMEGAAYLPK